MNNLHRLACLSALALSAALCPAWNSFGHKVVAKIAWDTLGQTTDGVAARDKFATILTKGDSIMGMSGPDDEESWELCATYPDVLKHGAPSKWWVTYAKTWNNKEYSATAASYPHDGEKTKCGAWHFYDTALNVPAGVTPDQRPIDGVKAFNLATTGIQSATNPKEKAWWAYWILHLAGDLHQPLHDSTNFANVTSDSGGFIGGDDGGNLYALSSRVSLHSFWDDVLGTSSNMDDIEAVAQEGESTFSATSFGTKLNDLNPADWVTDGAALAQSQCYSNIGHSVPGKGSQYYKDARTTALSQVTLAGYRLAQVIQQDMQ